MSESPSGSNEKLNGSIDRLAVALRDVVREASTEAVEKVEGRLNARIDQVKKDVQGVEAKIGDVEQRLTSRIDGVERNLNTRIDRAVEDIVAERQMERVPS